MKVLITGGTGLVGKEISKQLLSKNHEVVFLSRNPNPNSKIPQFKWDPEKFFMDLDALEDVEIIINLAGTPVNGKWTSSYKNEILKSRLDSLSTLYQSLEANEHKVRKLISASAVGFYQDSFDEIYREDAKAGNSFLAKVCMKWENAALKFENLNIQTSVLRIGIVLSTEGGALKEMIKPFKLGLGSPLGSGKQWMPWIHIEDLAGMFIFLMKSDSIGIFNGGGFEASRNKDFSKTLAKVLGKPFFAPNVPKFALKLLMGEASAIALSSTNVDSMKIINHGFEYKFKELKPALENLIV